MLKKLFIINAVAARRAKNRGGGTLNLGENMKIFEIGRMRKRFSISNYRIYLNEFS